MSSLTVRTPRISKSNYNFHFIYLITIILIIINLNYFIQGFSSLPIMQLDNIFFAFTQE